MSRPMTNQTTQPNGNGAPEAPAGTIKTDPPRITSERQLIEDLAKELERQKLMIEEQEEQMGDQYERLDQALVALLHLVQRIDHEARRGTPLLPKGSEDRPWAIEQPWDETYPVELMEARELLLASEYHREVLCPPNR